MWLTKSLENAIDDGAIHIAASVDRFTGTFHFWATRFFNQIKRPRMPGRLRIRVVSETTSLSGGKTMLNFEVDLPAPGAGDVVKRELTVTIAGGEPSVQELAGDATVATGFSGNDNDSVTLKLVDIDDAGNRSEPREQTATLVDNLAPSQPGELSIRVTSET